MANSIQIANVFISRALAEGRALTQMQLQKLVYIAHGWSLAINNTPLTSDSPQAWDYGPVYPILWEALRKYGSSEINRPIKVKDIGFGMLEDNAEDDVTADLSNEKQELLNSIYSSYSGFHAYQLSAMTHEQDTPWHQVYVGENRVRGVIDNSRIQQHFTEIARNRNANQ